LLLPLLQSYPYYCPHEVLFASFTSGQTTEDAVSRARKMLQEASQEKGMWDQQMKRVRNALSHVRFKMRLFGINIVPITETGYVLLKDRHNEDMLSARLTNRFLEGRRKA
jgi:hypothetical protein